MNIRKRIYQSLMMRMQQDGVIERVPGERKNPLTGCKQGLWALVGGEE